MGLSTAPIKVNVKAPNFKLASKGLQNNYAKFLRETHKEIGDMAKSVLKEAIKLTQAVATQKLLNSVTARFEQQDQNFIRVLGFKKPGSEYAYFANYGRDPGGPPPYSAILKWANAKGLDKSIVEPLRWHIAKYGSEGHHFMELAEPIIKRNAATILRNRLESFKRTYK